MCIRDRIGSARIDALGGKALVADPTRAHFASSSPPGLSWVTAAQHLVYEAMAQVRAGLDVLVSRLSGLIKGRRVGLLCHQASVTRDLTHAVDAIRALPGVTLAALFAPEHGIAGTAQDLIHVASTRDRATGLTYTHLRAHETP